MLLRSLTLGAGIAILRLTFVCVVCVGCNMSNLHALLPSSKLCYNDSLFLLYTLSSSVYTIALFYLLLGYGLFTMWRISVSYGLVGSFVAWMYFYNVFNGYNYCSIILRTNSMSLALQNGLLNIHPLLIYYVYVILGLLYGMIYCMDTLCNRGMFMVSQLYTRIGLAVSGMLLGALWASQELNWGGFWSWDPVELVSLILVLLLINLLHQRAGLFLRGHLGLMFSVAVAIYFIIRVGVVISIHSFIRSTSIPLYIKMVIVSLIAQGALLLYLRLYRGFGRYSYNVRSLSLRFTYIPQLLFVCTYLTIYGLFLINVVAISIPLDISLVHVCAICMLLLVSVHSHVGGLGSLVGQISMGFIGCYMANMSIVTAVVLFFVCQWRQFKYATFHYVMVVSYLVLHVYLINIMIYTSGMYYTIMEHLSFTDYSMLQNTGMFFESSFFIDKHSFYNQVKNQAHHTTGFTIFTNCFTSLYTYVSNMRFRYLFSMEIVYIMYAYGIIVFLLMGRYQSFRIGKGQVYTRY